MLSIFVLFRPTLSWRNPWIERFRVGVQWDVFEGYLRGPVPGGGGYSVPKRVPTAVQPLWSGGCRDARWLKKGGCPLIILFNRGAVRVFASSIIHHITIVYILICS